MVGGVVAAIIVGRSAWLFGGITTLPLFIHGFIQGMDGLQIVLSVCTSESHSPLIMSFRD